MTLRFDPTPIAPLPDLDASRLVAADGMTPDPALREAFEASGAGVEQLDRLLAGALCVTTGQQPGLLTGPLYTLYKALSVVALAQRLEEVVARPVVPVFWVAGDDHDFAEANHLHLLTAQNETTRLQLPDRPPDAPLTPMYREAAGPAVTTVLDAVLEHTPVTEFRNDVDAWLRRHYVPDRDLASAFAGALAELLGRFGLVVFRSTHPAAKAAMRPWLLHALENAPQIERRLVDQATATGAAPVAVGDGATTVMLECRLGRDRLVMHDGGFRTRRSGEPYDLDRLRALAADEPQRLSPNVLLRPVVEAAILPTLAYVAGPGELAYFPQCAPLYDLLGVAAQTPVARWSARVVETRIQKVLDKYGIAPDDLHLPDGQLERRLVSDEMPAAATEALDALRRALDEEYGRLQTAAVALDPTLAKPVESAHHQAARGLSAVEKRLVTHLKQRNTVLVQQVAKARANLFPLGKPQERVLNGAPFLIRYGDAFLDEALDAARAMYAALEPRMATP